MPKARQNEKYFQTSPLSATTLQSKVDDLLKSNDRNNNSEGIFI